MSGVKWNVVNPVILVVFVPAIDCVVPGPVIVVLKVTVAGSVMLYVPLSKSKSLTSNAVLFSQRINLSR